MGMQVVFLPFHNEKRYISCTLDTHHRLDVPEATIPSSGRVRTVVIPWK